VPADGNRDGPVKSLPGRTRKKPFSTSRRIS